MDCVKIICDKYNLSKSDVVEMLIENGVKLKGSIKHFPWNETKNAGCCEGLKYCGGLFIQCKQKVKDDAKYCSFCYKQSEQNEHGKPSAGTIHDRMSVGPLEYVDPKGRKVVPFSVYMKKKKIDRETVEIECKFKNIKIDEQQFVEIIAKRGRPKKDAKATTGNKKRNNSVSDGDVSIDTETEDIVIEGVSESEDIVDTPVDCEVGHEEYKEEEEEEQDDDENVESIEVEEIQYDGITYYKSETGEIFNEETEVVGKWDIDEAKIIFNN